MADREPLLLAADIGATKTALGLFAPAGRPLAQQTVHNSGFASFDPQLDRRQSRCPSNFLSRNLIGANTNSDSGTTGLEWVRTG